LLDEPLSALDALLRLELQTAIATIVRETGCTALLVTHDVDEALYLGNRVIVLDGSPARASFEVTIPRERRCSRSIDLAGERARLLGALGVDASRSATERPDLRLLRSDLA
jgi:sulfonate transport system ATP-binding protein